MFFYLMILGCLAAGIYLQTTSADNRHLIDLINKYIINLAMPALIIGTLPDLVFTYDALFAVLLPWLLIALSFAIVYPLGHVLGWPGQVKATAAVMMGLGNTAFLGIPVVKLLLGSEALPIAVIYDQLGSFMVLSIVATSVIAIYSGDTKVGVATVLFKIISFPPFISLLIALCIPSTQALGQLLIPIAWLGQTILPLAMLMIGLQLSFKIDPAYKTPMLVVVAGKLIFTPLLVALLGGWLAVRGAVLQPSVLQSAMPPMVTPAILLIAAGMAPRFVATTLGVATLLSFVSVPLLAHVLLGS